ncbi:MAG: hypothetical protein HY344_03035 [Candidatus Levybacteria bacterium]|nr:hypothetical protein [Candidatus Levybacteria bacterium]
MPEEKTHHTTHHENSHVLEWNAPGRPFKQRSKQFYLTAILMALFVEVILFLFSQYLLMIVVISLLFVSFALASVPPRNFQYRMSPEGIMIEDRFFLWKELYDFYFIKAYGIETLRIRTESFLPGELVLTIENVDKEKLLKTLIPYLPYREYVKPTFMEKSADWLTKNFPLESEKKKK